MAPTVYIPSEACIPPAIKYIGPMLSFAVGASLAARLTTLESRRMRRSYINRSANPDARQVRFFTALSSTAGLPNSSKVKRSRARVTAV